MPHQCAHWLAMTGFESAAGDRKGRPYGVTGGLCVRVVGDADPYGGRGGIIKMSFRGAKRRGNPFFHMTGVRRKGGTDCHTSVRAGSQ